MEKKEAYRKMKKCGAILGLCVGASVLLSGCGTVEPVIAEIKTKIGLTPETETELAEGQRKAEITVVSIVGNELTYREKETEAPETESETETEEVSENSSETEAGGLSEMGNETEAGEVPETGKAFGANEKPETDVTETGNVDVKQMNSGGGKRSGGSFPGGGEMPSGSFPGGGEMPSGSFPGGGEMSSGSFPGWGNNEVTQVSTSEETDASQMPDMSGMFAEMAGETVYLSVGVVVHADNGKDTTFAILEEGDVLQALFETRADGTEVITELWMEGRY